MIDYTRRTLHRRAAQFYRSARRGIAPQTLTDLEPQLLEFDHLIAAEDYDEAATLLDEIEAQYLSLWGFFERIVEMRTQVLGKLDDAVLQVRSLLSLADTYRMMGKAQLAVPYAEDAATTAEQADDSALSCRSLMVLGGIYRRLGQSERAIVRLRQALGLAKRIGDTSVQIQALLQLGQALYYTGKIEQGSSVLRQGLDLAAQMDDVRMQGDMQGQIGHTALWLGRADEAITLYKAALAVAERVGNRRGQGYWLNGLGEGYLTTGQFVTAQSYFRRAMQIAEEISDGHLMSFAGAFMAQSLLHNGDLHEALRVIIQARQFDNPQNNDFKAMIHAIVLARLGKQNEAGIVAREAQELGDELLDASPDFLEAKCTRGVVNLTYALLTQGEPQEATGLLLAAQQTLRDAFEDNQADGVMRRFMRIIDELHPMDRWGNLPLVTNALHNTLRDHTMLGGSSVELHVSDLDAARDFYSKLEFVVVWQTTKDGGYLTMRLGRAIVNFFSGTGLTNGSFFDRFPTSTPKGVGVELFFPVPDLQKYYSLVRNTLPEEAIVAPLKLQPWGQHDFRVQDPFGFYLRFSEPIDWLSPY